MDIYSDVVDDEKVGIKQLRKSIGWTEPVGTEASKWDVVTGEGTGMEVEDQTHAEILSELVQIHERLKRIEKKL